MRYVLISLLLAGSFLFSCTKDQSTISGTAWFVDSLGAETKASNVELNLRSDGIAGPIEKTAVTDSQGNYMFVDVTDGQHWMTSEATKDGHDYYYASDVIYTNKKSPVDIHPKLNW